MLDSLKRAMTKQAAQKPAAPKTDAPATKAEQKPWYAPDARPMPVKAQAPVAQAPAPRLAPTVMAELKRIEKKRR